MDQQSLKKRTKKFALEAIQLVSSLPNTSAARVLGNQLIRSGTSPGANYREACRARSRVEFIAKIGNCVTELDESIYWMELLVGSGIVNSEEIIWFTTEANELISIFVVTIKSAKRSGNIPPRSKS